MGMNVAFNWLKIVIFQSSSFESGLFFFILTRNFLKEQCNERQAYSAAQENENSTNIFQFQAHAFGLKSKGYLKLAY